MGTSRTTAELAAKFDRAANAVVGSNKANVEALALAVKTSVLAEATPPTGGDLKFSGTGNKSVGVRYKVEASGPISTARVRASGPMHWLESGVKPHSIAPKSLGGSRAQRGDFITGAFSSAGSLTFGKQTGALHFANGNFAKYARRAGGLPAKHVWTHGVDRVEGRQAEIVRANTMRSIGSVFG